MSILSLLALLCCVVASNGFSVEDLPVLFANGSLYGLENYDLASNSLGHKGSRRASPAGGGGPLLTGGMRPVATSSRRPVPPIGSRPVPSVMKSANAQSKLVGRLLTLDNDTLLERVIEGEMKPLRWKSNRRTKIFGDLSEVYDNLERIIRNYSRRVGTRSLLVTNGLPCQETTTLSPYGDSLVFTLPPRGARFCQAVVLPGQGSTLSMECPFLFLGSCASEFLYMADGADMERLYCDGRQGLSTSNLKALYLLYQRKSRASGKASAFCTITARVSETVKTAQSQPKDYQICPSSCGKASLNTGIKRIIGGTQAGSTEYPWMAKLIIKMNNGKGYQCGGSILNSRNILTAAHCLQNEQNIHHIDVTVGRAGSSPRQGEQLMKSNQWTKHSAYKGESESLHSDIAIIHLPKDLDLGRSSATPVCLAPAGDYENQLAVVTGWGVTHPSNRDVSAELFEVGVTISNTASCAKTYAEFQKIINHKQVCAADVGSDSCQGDSGGPLVMRMSTRWYQLGVVSFGISCANPAFPGVYTLVPAYERWIHSSLKGGHC